MILDSTSATIFGTIIRAAKANADCSTVPPESLDAVTHQIYAAVSMSAPDDLAPLFEDLSPNAQESLATLVSNGAAMWRRCSTLRAEFWLRAISGGNQKIASALLNFDPQETDLFTNRTVLRIELFRILIGIAYKLPLRDGGVAGELIALLDGGIAADSAARLADNTTAIATYASGTTPYTIGKSSYGDLSVATADHDGPVITASEFHKAQTRPPQSIEHMPLYVTGTADDRLSVSPRSAAERASDLFRKRYRQLNASEMALHDKIKDQATALAESVLSIGAAGETGAHVQLAIRHLEDAVYRAVKGLTA